ncbi:MAG TPA: transposase [Thermoanaerobaculia bacterium]|jgi:REP element-mobilizing transposase RayT
MSRRLRYVPEDGSLVEVTCRTLQSRFLLRPSRELDEIVVGVLGRAQRLYKVRVCGYMWASNHFHLLLDIDTAHQLSRFMCYVNSNIAREISRLYGWEDKIWSRRYQAIVISGEEEAQIARLRYLLGNGAPENIALSEAHAGSGSLPYRKAAAGGAVCPSRRRSAVPVASVRLS